MFPYRDENPQFFTPLVTISFIVITVLAWVFVPGMGAEPALSASVCKLGLIPADFLQRLQGQVSIRLSENLACVITGERQWYTPFSSMFRNRDLVERHRLARLQFR